MPQRLGIALVVDAVDEATDPGGLLTGLLPLARAGLRVLVGARRHMREPVRDAADLLIEPGASPPTVARGMASVSRRRWPRSDAQRATAQDRRAEPFLVARLLALSARSRHTVVDVSDGRWHTELPASVGAVLLAR